MPRRAYLQVSERLKEVVSDPARGIFRGLTTRQVAERVQARGFKCSQSTIVEVKRGGVGREETMRGIAQAFAGELVRDWEPEIAAEMKQSAGPGVAVDWFMGLCGKAQPQRAPVKRPIDIRIRQAVKDALDERAQSEPAEYLWRRVCFAAEGLESPPSLPCPPGGWLKLSFSEAESLARGFEEACRQAAGN